MLDIIFPEAYHPAPGHPPGRPTCRLILPFLPHPHILIILLPSANIVLIGSVVVDAFALPNDRCIHE